MRAVRRIESVATLIFVAGAAWNACAVSAAVQPGSSTNPATPQWKRQLQGADASRVKILEKQIDELELAGKFAEALEPAREVAETRTRVQGSDHWQAADARRRVETLRKIVTLPEQGQMAMKLAVESQAKAIKTYESGQFAAAEPLLRRVLEIRRQWLGDDHADTIASYDDVGACIYPQFKLQEAEKLFRKSVAARQKILGENHPKMAESYNNLAVSLNTTGRVTEAEPLIRKALAIRLETLGENDSDLAFSYNSFGVNLWRRGKYAEAEIYLAKALDIRLRTLGENHADTAVSLTNLAQARVDQGKYVDAEPLQRKALATQLKTRGDSNVQTPLFYNNLAACLTFLGKYAEAEPIIRRALALSLKSSGENQVTAVSYQNLAGNLAFQGKYAEAEPFLRKALAISLKARGNSDADSIAIMLNLASDLEGQAKPAQAEPLVREALAVLVKTRGEKHALTAQGYTALGSNLAAQQKWADAEPFFRKALEIRREVAGETTPMSAFSYYNLAYVLDPQGKFTEAEPLYRKALDIFLRAGGTDYRTTALIHDQLAINLDSQGKLAEAVANWTNAAAIYGRIRGGQATSGLERSFVTFHSPTLALAVALAREGQVREAWSHWEAALARGLLDDVSARSLRPLTADERRQEASLAGQLQKVDERITRLMGQATRTKDQDPQLAQLQGQQNALRGQSSDFENAMSRKYEAYAGKPSSLEEIQHALPARAALLGWLAEGKYLWACVVRHEGEPVWVRIPGSAKDGGWTTEDSNRNHAFGIAVAQNQPQWAAMAASIARDQISPLVPHLRDVKQLIVLPSIPMATVPLEVLIAVSPDWSARPVVSYAPSGSMFARLTAPRPSAPQPARLIALGDPAFSRPEKQLVPLPGTRREVTSIATLFPEGQVKLLIGAEATESALQGLAESGALKDYRFLHLATHGRANPNLALGSTIFLAVEPERAGASGDSTGLESVADGEVTAEQIVRTWNLDADLVVLSACESALAPLPAARVIWGSPRRSSSRARAASC